MPKGWATITHGDGLRISRDGTTICRCKLGGEGELNAAINNGLCVANSQDLSASTSGSSTKLTHGGIGFNGGLEQIVCSDI